MRRLFNFKYPKLTILLVSILLAYFLFSNESVTTKLNSLGSFGYLSVLIAGFLFSFGFSAPFAVGFFLTFSTDNIVFTAILGGFGAFLADLSIFKFIKMSFMDEFSNLKKNLKLRRHFHYKFLNSKLRLYITFVLAGIIIASPLPDELGVALLSGFARINIYIFSLISLFMNTFGILIMLFIANI
ncbi:MAG TPA: hypothetical protein VJG30_01305 [Candidatus Nanoarchaeia archaeon]|nr:hypothetical protein [Candidatus Nanoarchaeia archaeon]